MIGKKIHQLILLSFSVSLTFFSLVPFLFLFPILFITLPFLSIPIISCYFILHLSTHSYEALISNISSASFNHPGGDSDAASKALLGIATDGNKKYFLILVSSDLFNSEYFQNSFSGNNCLTVTECH